MFAKRIQIPVWFVALIALVLLSVGGFAGSTLRTDDIRLPDLRIALPPDEGWAGIYFLDMDESMADALGIRYTPGVVVNQVQCGPLQAGDVITSINAEPVASVGELSTVAENAGGRAPLDLMVIRDGAPLLMTVSRPNVLSVGVTPAVVPSVPSALPSPVTTIPVQSIADQVYPPLIVSTIRGIQVTDLTQLAKDQLGLSPTATGVLVAGVDSSMPAEVAGLRQNDVIVEVNSTPVNSVTDFERMVTALGPNSVTLKINRRGTVGYVSIPLQ